MHTYTTSGSTDTYWVFEPGTEYAAKPNFVLDKSFAFAIRIVNLHKWLRKHHPTIGPLATQVLKAGTSIGANTNEADCAFSKREFAAKIGIALKEARETAYWLKLLHKTDYLDEAMFASLYSDCEELIRLYVSILKTTRSALGIEAQKRQS
ncbi:four helix bundle protein [Fibrella sp. WM1]|uniref:four helix bundle protein n=1 Tax=Fibrella musci TaxID=3242485 RepID=UPI00352235E9